MEPNYAVAPGDHLQEFLDDSGTTQQQAADQLGYTRKHVSEILHGRAPVTPETATRLHRLTGIPAQSWLVFEAGYRADLARLQDEAALAKHVDDIPAQSWTIWMPICAPPGIQQPPDGNRGGWWQQKRVKTGFRSNAEQ